MKSGVRSSEVQAAAAEHKTAVAAGRSRAAESVLQLQRSAGNRAVGRLLSRDPTSSPQRLPYVGALQSYLNPLNQAARLFVGRPLSQDEKDILDEVFGASLATSLIRIRENSTIIAAGNCYRTVGNIINCPPGPISRKTLIHEASHVWQHQNSVPYAYALSALSAQAAAEITQGDWQKAYDYKSLEGTVPWAMWNAEQQAHWIEDHERLPPNWWWEGVVADAATIATSVPMVP